MKYIPVPEFETVASALNFNTPDCNVTGGCDLYTTKSTAADKKLLKAIDEKFNTQHSEFLKFSEKLSPPEKKAILSTSPNLSMLSQLSAFGPLSEVSSRRIFGYMIATLNASHPHYDFSDLLRPDQFKRQRNLRTVIAMLDSILQNVRAKVEADVLPDPEPVSCPQMWALIDKEMRLEDCTIYSFHPDTDPFQEDECAIWTLHYFFYNRIMKRVAYLYLRVVPVVSSQSPQARIGSALAMHPMRALHGPNSLPMPSHPHPHEFIGSMHDDDDDIDDGFIWNRDEDGDLVPFSDDAYGIMYGDTDESDLDEPSSPVDVNEDIASRMEM